MGTGLSENIVDEIKSRCNIVDVIGRRISLKKAGSNYKGLCPFHNEKTPSFIVSESKQYFTCYGCGAKGDVIGFVEQYENLDFRGAIEKLAEEYGIELKSGAFAEEGRRSVYYEVNREAAAFFYRNFTKQANKGYDYMVKRGILPETLRKFGIGYAEDRWDSLCRHMAGKEIEIEGLLTLGLAALAKGRDQDRESGGQEQEERPERYYDKFRDRVMFPIINTRGKVIGFGGRALGDREPKYLNSPESPVFQKKNNLYGLNLTRQDISKEDCAILVEGYMDVISLYQHGIRNVSASLGTALTENQAAMLKRYTKNVVLAYDSDSAGQAAALRGMDILHRAGCKVRVLVQDKEKDPDEFIKKYGKDAFLELVRKALPFAEYKLYRLRERVDLGSTEGSVAFLQEVAKILNELGPVEADAYIKRIAAETGISEGALRLEAFGNYGGTEQGEVPRPDRREAQRNRSEAGAAAFLEKNFIKLMLTKSSYVPKVKEYAGVFLNSLCYRIYEIIVSLYREDEEIDIRKLADALNEEENRLLVDIIENINIAERDAAVFQDCVAYITRQKAVKREEEIYKELAVVEGRDAERASQLMKELIEIRKAK